MKEKEITVTLNGFHEKVPMNMTIAGLIASFSEKDAHVIVEKNNVFIFPQQYNRTKISDGDTIEFINPDFGG